MARASIRIRRNFSFSRLADDLTSEAAMRTAGEELASKIVARTRSGVDEDGKAFAATKSGESTDLHQTGQLLADVGVVEADRHHVVVGPRTERSARIAAHLEAGSSTTPARKFLGISPGWLPALKRRLLKRGPR